MTTAGAVARTSSATVAATATDPAARGGRDRDRGVGQWPPERAAAVRLARARATVTRAAATGDPRAQALARRHIDTVEADARTCLSRPAPAGGGPAEQAASARARAGLAGMLDPDPVTRAAGTEDLTRVWPAEHLDLLRAYADHDHDRRVQGLDGRGDAVDRARAAVAAIPPADVAANSHADGTDPDVALGDHHHRDVVATDELADNIETSTETSGPVR